MKKTATILVVEDDQALNEAYELILKSAGHDVKTALNGEEALDLLKDNYEPEIIFLDLRMPVLDGIGFLKQYDVAKHPKTTVIVFSNYDAHEEVDAAYKLGAHRYVLKARAAPKELLRIVDTVINAE